MSPVPSIDFDAVAYAHWHSDAIGPGEDAWLHYARIGARQGRAPGASGEAVVAAHLAYLFGELGDVEAWTGIGIRDGYVVATERNAQIRIVLETSLPRGWTEFDLKLEPREREAFAVEMVLSDGNEPVPLKQLAIGHYSALLRIPELVTRIDLRPSAGFRLGPDSFRVLPQSRAALTGRIVLRAAGLMIRNPRAALGAANRFLRKARETGVIAVSPTEANARTPAQNYADWIAYRETPPPASAAYDGEFPRFVVLTDVSVADVESHSLAVRIGAVEEVAGLDHRVPGHMQWLVWCQPGVALARGALDRFAAAAQAHPEAVVFYGDHDRIDRRGQRKDPVFKPDWSPDLFGATNYAGVAVAVRMDAVDQAIADHAAAGAYSLLLHVSEHVPPEAFVHLADVVAHVEDGPDLPEDPSFSEGTLQAHYERQGIDADVEPIDGSPYLRSVFAIPAPAPLVSLIMPMRDKADLSERCLSSILEKSTYRNFEVLIVDNNSVEPATGAFFARATSHPQVRILQYREPFNYSAINNFAERAAKGDVLGLINNDVEIITAGWIEELGGHALRPDIGCVGAMLYYPDDRVQHAGIVLGIGGATGHGHRFVPRGDGGYCDSLKTVREVSAVTGACLFIRRETYQAVGGLNEALFPVTFNDVDLCLKVREVGLRNLWTPFAELYHRESVTRGADTDPKNRDRLRRELLRMRERWGGLLERDPYYSPNLTRQREDFSIRID